MTEEIVLATGNAHKVAEIKAILGGSYIIKTPAEEGINVDIDETGSTFAENAYIKAYAIASLTGKLALADDSGLAVAALGGEPGIYSARYAGDAHDDKANTAKLLGVMQGITERGAKFVSAVVLCRPDGSSVCAIGEAEGEITNEEHGEGGFGYDPVFYSFELGKTFAEASASEKNLVSHRKRALALLAEKLVADNFFGCGANNVVVGEG